MLPEYNRCQAIQRNRHNAHIRYDTLTKIEKRFSKRKINVSDIKCCHVTLILSRQNWAEISVNGVVIPQNEV